MKYETYLIDLPIGQIEGIKRINEDGSETFIPTDPTNSDYQAYLASLEKPAVKK